MESLTDVITRMAKTYRFRPRGPFESWTEYRAALIPFAETRDYAAAHEVRVGRAQAELVAGGGDGVLAAYASATRRTQGPRSPIR